MPESDLLEALIGAAVEAGRAALALQTDTLRVDEKADSSPVTHADRAAEAIILERLATCAGGVAVVAEEEAACGRVPQAGAEFFLVDPLDGTREFIAGRPEFTVNIALVRGTEPVLGVVYAPALGRLYAGDVAASRAFAAGEPARPEPGRAPTRRDIRVRPAPAGGITAVASRSHDTPETETYLARYTVSERVSIGSSLKFCLIAEGRADLYPRLGPTMEWDTAAGHAVLVAAGGSVVGPDGRSLRYGKSGYRNPWFVASGSLVPLPIAA